MKLAIVAVGQKMPDWAQTAFDDYAKRFPPDLRLLCQTVKTEPRSGGKTAAQLMQAEAQRLTAAVAGACGKGCKVVALDERVTALSTRTLAEKLKQWQSDGDDVALLIGGPDGLLPELRNSAHERIRLSDLTLPHALARVLLVEQLYRAWSLNSGHPYHRE